MPPGHAGAAQGPCAGIRVLDFSTVISGPLCTQVLGDLGADVIKKPPAGDSGRYAGAPFRAGGLSGLFAQMNRNKRSLVLDLKHPDAPGVVGRLAAAADVVVENFRPGVAERLGIGWDRLHAANPRLVYVAISGFGPDGPYAELPAYDHVIQALTGLMPLHGGSGAPRLVQGGVADKSSALTAVSAVLAALLARERGAGGQRIEVPMLDAYAAFALPESLIARSFPPDPGSPVPLGDVFRTWSTADGHVVGLVIQDAQFRGLCQTIERDDVARDPRFATIAARFANLRELGEVLEAEICKWPTAEFIERARRFGAPFERANDLAGFLADPQTAHNRTVVETEDPRFGRAVYLRHPVRYQATPASLRRHPPRLGEHTAELLGEAGFAAEEIDALRSAGAIR
jgi:crotonobetainyl-CoA:carnitine CoA-transferase CaiB-like acyl-CoA transferase